MYTRHFPESGDIPIPGNYSGSFFASPAEDADGTPEPAPTEAEAEAAAPEPKAVPASARSGKRLLSLPSLGGLFRTDWLSGDLLLLVLLLLLLGEDGEDDLLPMMLILLFFVR